MELCRVMRDLIELTLSIRDSKVKMVKMVKMHQENLRKIVKVCNIYFWQNRTFKGKSHAYGAELFKAALVYPDMLPWSFKEG